MLKEPKGLQELKVAKGYFEGDKKGKGVKGVKSSYRDANRQISNDSYTFDELPWVYHFRWQRKKIELGRK